MKFREIFTYTFGLFSMLVMTIAPAVWCYEYGILTGAILFMIFIVLVAYDLYHHKDPEK